MKKLALIGLMMGLVSNGFSQPAYVFFDTSANTSLDPHATSNGRWWLYDHVTYSLLNQDVNAQLLGGTSSSSLSVMITLRLSDNTALDDIMFWGGEGLFQDQSGNAYGVPGVNLDFGESGTYWFKVVGWTGAHDSLASAQADPFAAWGMTDPFSQTIFGIPSAPNGLDNMPAMVLSGVPEPGTMTLAGLGAAALLALRRRK